MALSLTKEGIVNRDLITKHPIVKISAGAGTGKTTFIVMVTQEVKEPSLYLAFNKKMVSAIEDSLPRHVTASTIHSLAYRDIGHSYRHKLSRPMGRYVNVAFTPMEVFRFFDIQTTTFPNQGIEIRGVKTATIVVDLIKHFEYSSYDNVGQIPPTEAYKCSAPLQHIREEFGSSSKGSVAERRKLFLDYVKSVYKIVYKLWLERTNVDSVVMASHDTYLKLFQLSKPDLSYYKYIYVDEAQDINEAIIDIIETQTAHSKIVLVGDSNQQIYAWRGAVNSLTKIKGESGDLSHSFRYGELPAEIANAILPHRSTPIVGHPSLETKVGWDVVDTDTSYATIYRTNLALLMQALRYRKQGVSFNIIVDINDLIKMLDSALNLHAGALNKVKHAEIVPYSSWAELKEVAELVRGSLSTMVHLIESKEAEKVLDFLKSYRDSPTPRCILTTAHKSKGLEFDQVVLGDDFPLPEGDNGSFIPLDEPEANLLYVALTRAKSRLNINKALEKYCLYSNIELSDEDMADL